MSRAPHDMAAHSALLPLSVLFCSSTPEVGKLLTTFLSDVNMGRIPNSSLARGVERVRATRCKTEMEAALLHIKITFAGLCMDVQAIGQFVQARVYPNDGTESVVDYNPRAFVHTGELSLLQDAHVIDQLKGELRSMIRRCIACKNHDGTPKHPHGTDLIRHIATGHHNLDPATEQDVHQCALSVYFTMLSMMMCDDGKVVQHPLDPRVFMNVHRGQLTRTRRLTARAQSVASLPTPPAKPVPDPEARLAPTPGSDLDLSLGTPLAKKPVSSARIKAAFAAMKRHPELEAPTSPPPKSPSAADADSDDDDNVIDLFDDSDDDSAPEPTQAHPSSAPEPPPKRSKPAKVPSKSSFMASLRARVSGGPHEDPADTSPASDQDASEDELLEHRRAQARGNQSKLRAMMRDTYGDDSAVRPVQAAKKRNSKQRANGSGKGKGKGLA